MKERPILFSAPMVRAILEGRKTQTRRVVKPQPSSAPKWRPGLNSIDGHYGGLWEIDGRMIACPYGQPGDRLWVRETWAHDGPDLETVRSRHEDAMSGLCYGPYYRADRVHENTGLTWRPSIHMPRWASRITLEITAVRVERLNDISEEDAYAEGCFALGDCECTAVAQFRSLWESINGPGSWALNPWVWVIEFRRLPA